MTVSQGLEGELGPARKRDGKDWLDRAFGKLRDQHLPVEALDVVYQIVHGALDNTDQRTEIFERLRNEIAESRRSRELAHGNLLPQSSVRELRQRLVSVRKTDPQGEVGRYANETLHSLMEHPLPTRHQLLAHPQSAVILAEVNRERLGKGTVLADQSADVLAVLGVRFGGFSELMPRDNIKAAIVNLGTPEFALDIPDIYVGVAWQAIKRGPGRESIKLTTEWRSGRLSKQA